MICLVTGSAGFVGRHVVAHLRRRGWEVVGYDIETGNDARTVFEHAHLTRYDLIVHAAASAPHRAAIDTQPWHFARNLQLDAAMFDWAVRTGQGRVVYLSSSAAYPIEYQRAGRHVESLREDMIDDVQEPDSAYGWTKLTGERLAEQARKTGLPVTVVRPFSGYGEDQSENFPFRAIIERARRREDPFTIWGSGEQVRDWIHISDVIAGMLAVAESGTVEPVNLCTGVGTSITELARMATELAGYAPAFEYLADKPAGVAYRVGDPARLHQFYKPVVSLQMGVEWALKG
jgi:nucleoside-diphosphate-sugar epimerase